MIDIYRINFPKEKLRELSPEERSLLFLLGYAANQLVIFKKLVVFSSNKTPEEYVHQHVSGAQTQILVRHMIGVVSEAWELINRRFIQKGVGREYQSLLSSRGMDALSKLKSHFGSSNVLNKIRNNFAFHHPYEAEVDAAFNAACKSEDFAHDWNWNLAKENINCFYFISDLVVVHGMLLSIGEADLVDAQIKMLAELNLVFDEFIAFTSSFFDALLTKYFAPEIIAEVCAKIDDAPVAFDVDIPFYIEPPSEEDMVAEGLPAH